MCESWRWTLRVLTVIGKWFNYYVRKTMFSATQNGECLSFQLGGMGSVPQTVNVRNDYVVTEKYLYHS